MAISRLPPVCVAGLILRRTPIYHPAIFHRHLQTSAVPVATPPRDLPLRKRLKNEAKRQKTQSKNQAAGDESWELTVGLELHVQLNSPFKLFSPSTVTPPSETPLPNSHVTPFDLSVPGSQPILQKEVLIPALRAALALGCTINTVSHFDRKHYFWWDQPAGYQITQFYSPFASNGQLRLTARDGIAAEDGKEFNVRIKQVQLEQDTAKTLSQPGDIRWIDFNRAGTPLIEIITEPDFHQARTAAAFVQKVQSILNTFDACTVGMESGGLRADVNVSVRRRDDPNAPLGTRTEIKNLNTFKAIEDAILAEKNRQIKELEAGGKVSCETRGWTLGSKETRRLRGKEGEVDYRYMPDADIPPLVIREDLIAALRESVEKTPDWEVDILLNRYGVKQKDALILTAPGGEAKIQYFYRLVEEVHSKLETWTSGEELVQPLCVLAANWVVHEFGRLEKISKDTDESTGETLSRVPVDFLAELLYLRYTNKVTLQVAKEVFVIMYRDGLFIDDEPASTMTEFVDAHELWFKEISQDEYQTLAAEVVAQNVNVGDAILKTAEPPQGKVMWLLGKMLRSGVAENMVPENAEAALRTELRRFRDANQ